MNTKHLYAAAFAVTVAWIIFQDIKQCRRLPWPARIIAVGILFGILDLVSLLNEELAGVVAVGMTLAALVNTQPGGKLAPDCNPTGTASAMLDAMNFQSGTMQPSDYQNAMDLTQPAIQQPGQTLT